MIPKRLLINPGILFSSKLTYSSGLYHLKKKIPSCSVTLNPSPSLYFARCLRYDIKAEKLCNKKPAQKIPTACDDETKKVQIEVLQDFVRTKSQPSDDEWANLVQILVDSNSGIRNDANVHGKIIDYCERWQNLPLAKSYLLYMKKNGYKMSSMVVAKFLGVCYTKYGTLSEEDCKNVQYFTNHLLSKYTVMDSTLGTAVVRGLSILGDWKKCKEVIDELEKFTAPQNSAYSALLKCLLANEKFELALSKLGDCLDKKRRISDDVYFEWIEKNSGNSNHLQQLLILFQDNNVIPGKRICDRLIEAFSQLPLEEQLHGEFTKVLRNGQCQSCKKKLQSNTLSAKDFDKLRETFLNRVLVGENIFTNTTPDELKTFLKCVQLHAPFDVVVDGLNVMYRTGVGSKRSVSELAKLLKDMVDYYFKRGKKVLVIGKKHMKHLPSWIMESIREKSVLFLIDNSSEDDRFTIYATLYSGLKCVFVTNDFMRSEKFLLNDPHLTDLFKKWQLSHQVTFEPEKKLILKQPLQFQTCVQKDASQNWHLPYYEDSYKEININEEPKWLCLRK